MMARIKGVAEAALTVISILFILWVVVSWADIDMHNHPGEEHVYQPWNAFVLVTEVRGL